MAVATNFTSFCTPSSSSLFCSVFGFRVSTFRNAIVTGKPRVPLHSNLTAQWTSLPEGCGPSLQRGQKPNQAQLWSSFPQSVPATDAKESSSGLHEHRRAEHWIERHKIQNVEQIEQSIEYRYVSDAVHFDREQFTRGYHIAALRVAADECWDLAKRIKGHLLNWPRLKNVARVPGDDVEEQMQELFWNREEKNRDVVRSVREAIYADVSTSEKLDTLSQCTERVTKSRNKGLLAFPELDRLSKLKGHVESSIFGGSKRSKIKGRAKKGSIRRHTKKVTCSNLYATVEVIEDGPPIRGDNESPALTFEKSVWRGPTRLLLLDEQHAGKSVDDLPMAVQAALRQSIGRDNNKVFELVQCRLFLHYAYWSPNELLGELLPAGIIVPSAFETVGHVAHLKLQSEHLPYRYAIAQVLLDKFNPRIRSVIHKRVAIQSQHDSMQLELLAGSRCLVTTVVEHGLVFHLDLATMYWNTRLVSERHRLLETFDKMDVVCDVFAGVGPLAVAAAKKVRRVYANDLNPAALMYLRKNVVQNEVSAKITIFGLEGKEFIRKILTTEPLVFPTHFVLNLPSHSLQFIDPFRGAFKKTQNLKQPLPNVHLYGFSKSSEPEHEFAKRVVAIFGEKIPTLETHLVLQVAPKKWMLCASFQIPERFAYYGR